MEDLFSIQWIVGGMLVGSISDLPGHIAVTSVSTYEDVVVDNYTYLTMTYHCSAILRNGTNVDSQVGGEFSVI